MEKLTMLQLIKILNEDNAYEVLTILTNMSNKEGKNAVIYALDNKLYRQAAIMLGPVKIPDKDEYKIFYDAFNNTIKNGIKPLKWPSTKENSYEDLTGIFDTREDYYSYYSIYSYIMNMKNETVKNALLSIILNPPVDQFNQIRLINVEPKEVNKSAVIHTRKDIIKYTPIPFIRIIENLYAKGINARAEFSNHGYGAIIINFKDLNPANQIVGRELINKGLASTSFGNIVINYHFNNETTITQLEEDLYNLLNAFNYQTPVVETQPINDYYNRLRRVLSSYNKTLPENITTKEKIKICQKYNRYLTADDTDSFFYMHPADKVRKEAPAPTIKF